MPAPDPAQTTPDAAPSVTITRLPGQTIAQASKSILDLADTLDDPRIAAEFGLISGRTMEVISYEDTTTVEAWATVRFKGDPQELQIRALRPSLDHIAQQFHIAYTQTIGPAPANRPIEITTLTIRRIGPAPRS